METRGLACLATKSSIGIYSIRQRAMCLCAAGLGRRQRVSVRNKHEALVQLYTGQRARRRSSLREIPELGSFMVISWNRAPGTGVQPARSSIYNARRLGFSASAAALSPTLEGLRVTPLVRASDAATVPLPSLWRSNTPFGIADEVSVCLLRTLGIPCWEHAAALRDGSSQQSEKWW